MAYFEQFRPLDGTTLFSGTIAATGAGSAIDTMSYGSVAIQVSGTGQITAQIEGSNDGLDWDVVLLNNSADVSVTDTITSADETFFIKTGHRYIRYNIAYYSGSPTITFVGRAGTGPSAADNLAAAFNPDTPLQVAFGNGVKQDRNGALILSDGIPYFMQGNNTYVFNASGYSTIVLQLAATQTATVSQSIDGTFFTTTNMATYGGSLFGTPAAAGITTGPVIGQYVKIVLTVAAAGPTQAAVLFKQASIVPTTNLGQIGGSAVSAASAQLGTNIAQIGGSAVAVATAQLGVNLQNIGNAAAITGGVTGSLAVGGNIVTGSSVAAANPITVGGVDQANLVRRAQTDMVGRLMSTAAIPYFHSYNSNSPQANTALPMNAVGAIPASYQQSAALNVQDTSQYEGQNFTELLAQILLELRILNQQMYELPRLIANGQGSNDPPELFRQEPSIFNQ
jgi:hypothetical protein